MIFMLAAGANDADECADGAFGTRRVVQDAEGVAEVESAGSSAGFQPAAVGRASCPAQVQAGCLHDYRRLEACATTTAPEAWTSG